MVESIFPVWLLGPSLVFGLQNDSWKNLLDTPEQIISGEKICNWFYFINAPMNDIDYALDLANCKRQKWLYQGPWRWPFRFYMYFICHLMTFYNTEIICHSHSHWEFKTHGSNLIFVKMAQLLPLIFFRLPTQIPNNLSCRPKFIIFQGIFQVTLILLCWNQ